MASQSRNMMGSSWNGVHPTSDPATIKPATTVCSSGSSSSVRGHKESLYTDSAQSEFQVANHCVLSPSTPPEQASSVTRKQSMTSKPGFMTLKDGSHEHFVKRPERQGNLFDRLRNSVLLSVKKGSKEELTSNRYLSSRGTFHNEKDWLKSKMSQMSLLHTMTAKYGRCGEVIGCGAFGTVRVAQKSDAQKSMRKQVVAIKELEKMPRESAKNYYKRLTAEFCISSSMHHPNIVTTFDLVQNNKGIYCQVMEYCAGGDLHTAILLAGQLEVAEADCFFKQLMRGVEYMHEMGVAHRDLKPENILLTQSGVLKITDFGNAECFRLAWETEAHMTGGVCGSTPYIAPEVYTEKQFDARIVDVWACGVIYIAMRTGRHLWRLARRGKDNSFDQYLQDRKHEAGYKPIEALKRRKCRNVIYSTLDPNPTRRLTAHQVLLSEWVRGIQLCHTGNIGI